MSQNQTLVEMGRKKVQDFYIGLKDKRAFWVMDRVALTQVLYLLITGVISTLVVLFNLESIFIDFWYFFVLLLPFFIGFLGIIKKKRYYPSMYLFQSQIFIFIVWISLTICLGVKFDTIFGIGTTIFVSSFIAIYYIIGYVLARIIRKVRFKFSKKTWAILMSVGIITSILLTLIPGLILLFRTVEEYQIRSLFLHDYGEFLSCLPCALSIFFMVSGIGIVFSMVMNYAILADLTLETAKSNVIALNPIKLYFKYLLGTTIFIFIFWVFLEIFIPPIPGGGGGSGGGSGGSGGGGGGGGGNSYRNMSKLLTENIINKEIKESNKYWGSLHIPLFYIPTIVSYIKNKEDEKRRKKLNSLGANENVPFSVTYKCDFNPRSKHYSSNYSPYNKHYNKKISDFIERMNNPINENLKYMKELDEKFKLK